MEFFALDQLLGSIQTSGRVDVLAYAVDGDQVPMPVVLYVSAPKTSIDALRVTLNNAGSVRFTSADGRDYNAINLYGPEEYNLTVFRTRHEPTARDLALLLHPALTTKRRDRIPFDGYVLVQNGMKALEDDNFINSAGEFIRAFVNVTCLPDWYPWLVRQGMKKKIIRPLISEGCTAYAVNNNEVQWTKLISTGLKDRHIEFPTEQNAKGD